MNEKPEALRLVNVSAVEKELRRLHAENERLREALVRHGKHGANCDAYRGCVCGLDAALRREEA